MDDIDCSDALEEYKSRGEVIHYFRVTFDVVVSQSIVAEADSLWSGGATVLE